MMVWLGHEPLGPQGGRYGYGKLARRLFNVHVSYTGATSLGAHSNVNPGAWVCGDAWIVTIT